MLIIVEGPDGAGKSTLARELADASGSTMFHYGAYLGEPVIAPHYFGAVCRALHGEDVVMDRSWYSEPIYGAACRGGADRVSAAELRALELVAAEARAVVVLCLPPFEVCREAWAARRDREYVRLDAQMRTVYDLYAGVRGWALDTCVYDRTSPGARLRLAARLFR